MVYVDLPTRKWRGYLWSHLVADDPDELHAFAAQLGLRRWWFQDKRLPHYDTMHFQNAVELGAQVVHSRVIVKKAKLLRREIDLLNALYAEMGQLLHELAFVRWMVEHPGVREGLDFERLLLVIPR